MLTEFDDFVTTLLEVFVKDCLGSFGFEWGGFVYLGFDYVSGIVGDTAANKLPDAVVFGSTCCGDCSVSSYHKTQGFVVIRTIDALGYLEGHSRDVSRSSRFLSRGVRMVVLNRSGTLGSSRSSLMHWISWVRRAMRLCLRRLNRWVGGVFMLAEPGGYTGGWGEDNCHKGGGRFRWVGGNGSFPIGDKHGGVGASRVTTCPCFA